jgi:hypothetical protein
LAGTTAVPRGTVEGLADVKESAVDRGHGGDAQGVALAAPYDDGPVERGPLDVVQLSGTKEVGELARHIEDDRQFRGRSARVGGRSVARGRACHGRKYTVALKVANLLNGVPDAPRDTSSRHFT